METRHIGKVRWSKLRNTFRKFLFMDEHTENHPKTGKAVKRQRTNLKIL